MSLEEEPQPQMYNAGFDSGDANIAVRATIPPATVINEIRATLRAIDPNLALDRHSHDGRSGFRLRVRGGGSRHRC